jgi:hypothetical protein
VALVVAILKPNYRNPETKKVSELLPIGDAENF